MGITEEDFHCHERDPRLFSALLSCLPLGFIITQFHRGYKEFALLDVGQFAIDWYGVGRGYQNNRRLSTHHPTDGERIESNS